MVPDCSLGYAHHGGNDLELHLFRPAGDGIAPAILFFHGGSWQHGSPHQFYPHAAYLASRGMVAMAVEYRLRSRHGSTARDAVDDARAALAWTRAHAAELGVDPKAIVLAGGSAGGHLALLAAAEEPEGAVVAAAVFNPVVDTTTRFRRPELLGTEPEALSPRHRLRPGLSPVLIQHGADDACVPLPEVEAYVAASTTLGNFCELAVYPDKGHGFFNFERDVDAYCATLRRLDAFLAGRGLLTGPGPDDGELLRRATRLPPRAGVGCYLLLGQSNMAGAAPVVDADRQPHLGLVALDPNGLWAPAREPLHAERSGAGPGTTLGLELLAATADEAVALVPCAVGGTPLADWERDGPLFWRAIERCRQAQADAVLRGICWLQGERDARTPAATANYGERLQRMIADLRTELGATQVPFAIGEIGRYLYDRDDGDYAGAREINAALARVVAHTHLCRLVSSEGLDHRGDGLHYGTEAVHELGRRFAAALRGDET